MSTKSCNQHNERVVLCLSQCICQGIRKRIWTSGWLWAFRFVSGSKFVQLLANFKFLFIKKTNWKTGPSGMFPSLRGVHLQEWDLTERCLLNLSKRWRAFWWILKKPNLFCFIYSYKTELGGTFTCYKWSNIYITIRQDNKITLDFQCFLNFVWAWSSGADLFAKKVSGDIVLGSSEG